MSKTTETPADTTEAPALTFGDLVRTGDGEYAIVTDLDGDGVPDLLILGRPVRHELPVTLVG